MIIYVCMHCRKELYKEDEEIAVCEDHPYLPAEATVAQQDNIEESDN